MATVLIVDDEAALRDLVGGYLRAEGLTVRETSTGTGGPRSRPARQTRARKTPMPTRTTARAPIPAAPDDGTATARPLSGPMKFGQLISDIFHAAEAVSCQSFSACCGVRWPSAE